MEMAANASLGRPLALVGAKLTTCLTETFAAVPQKRPRTSEKGALVKPSENKSTRLCRHNLLRVSAIKNLGGHDECLDAGENLEFRRASAFVSHRDFTGPAVHALSTRSGNDIGVAFT